MNPQMKAAILVGCALVLGAASFFILSGPDKEPVPIHRAEVKQTTQAPSAPDWVNQGQKPKPDYTPSTAEAQNATVIEVEAETPQKVIEVTEDSVVTLTFVESLADFLLRRFAPETETTRPTSTATAKSLNVYYGREMEGFAVSGDDIRETRKNLLNYAFTPAKIKVLYDMYAPVFVAHLVDTALSDDREYSAGNAKEVRVLSEQETMVMLKSNASKAEQTAAILRAIADDATITELAGKYLRAAKAVERANLQLQAAITDGKGSTSRSGERLKQALLQRERVKASIVTKLKKACPGCSEAELFYLAQWSYRRVINSPEGKRDAFAVAAAVLDDLAERFRTAASELK